MCTRIYHWHSAPYSVPSVLSGVRVRTNPPLPHNNHPRRLPMRFATRMRHSDCAKSHRGGEGHQRGPVHPHFRRRSNKCHCTSLIALLGAILGCV